MLDKNDLGNIYNLLERVQVTGQEVEKVYKLKLKLIGILQTISQKELEANKNTLQENVVNPGPNPMSGSGMSNTQPATVTNTPVENPVTATEEVK